MKSRRPKKALIKKKPKVRSRKHYLKRGGSENPIDIIEREYQTWILDYVLNTNNRVEKDIIDKYKTLRSTITTNNNDSTQKIKLNVKNIINNLIEYAESSEFKKKAASKNTNNWDARRMQIVDQFTRLNTTPYIDPYLDRIVSTFWPEFDAINYIYKPPDTNIVKRTTRYVSDFYDNEPIYDKNNKDKKKEPGTYSHREIRQYDDYHGDKMQIDAFGVEEAINALIHTGSNLGWAATRVPTYTEQYEQKEKIDVSKMMKPK
jgi:hypothetical protein